MMISKKHKHMIFYGVIVLILCVTVLWDQTTLNDGKARLENLSESGLQFNSMNCELEETEAKLLSTVDYKRRMYWTSDSRFVITLIDGSKNRHAVHDPVYCFRGAGWDINELDTRQCSYQHFSLINGTENKEIIYFYSNGRQQYKSYMQYRIACSLRRLTFGLSGEEPILIVLQSLSGQTLNWDKIISVLPELQTL